MKIDKKFVRVFIVLALSLTFLFDSVNVQANSIENTKEISPLYKIPQAITYKKIYSEYKGPEIYVTVMEHGTYYGGVAKLVHYESGRGHRYTYKGVLTIVGSPY